MTKGTKLRFLMDNDPHKLEAQIEGLPFKVEIKSIYMVGQKHIVWFTLLDQNNMRPVTMEPEKVTAKPEATPVLKKSKKKTVKNKT